MLQCFISIYFPLYHSLISVLFSTVAYLWQDIVNDLPLTSASLLEPHSARSLTHAINLWFHHISNLIFWLKLPHHGDILSLNCLVVCMKVKFTAWIILSVCHSSQGFVTFFCKLLRSQHCNILDGQIMCIHTYTQMVAQAHTVLQQMDKYLSAAVWYFLPAHGSVARFHIATKKYINF